MTLTLVVPRTFRRSKNSSSDKKRHSAIEHSDSKVQDILGLTNEDMRSVRNHSLSSSSTARFYGSNSSEATTVQVATIDGPTGSKAGSLHSHISGLKPYSILVQGAEARHDSSSAGASSTRGKLKAQPSDSTLHSFYDRNKAPLSVSQQTSESSTRDFALRKGTSSIVTSTSEEMEHARQLRMFSSSRDLRRSETKAKAMVSPARPKTTASTTLGEPPHQISRNRSGSNDQQDASTSLLLTNIPVGSARPRTDHGSPISNKSVRKPRQQCAPAQPIAQHPMIKIHVRRPKAGTRHWFDNIDDEFSDGENNEETVDEPELRSSFVAEVQDALENIHIGQEEHRSSPVPQNQLNIAEKSPKPSQRTVSDVPNEGSNSFPARVSSLHQQQLRGPRTDPFKKVNLNVQSALNLSSSDDEDDVSPLLSESVTKTRASIRGSMLSEIEIDDDSEIEIGLAQAILARSRVAITVPRNQNDVPKFSNLNHPEVPRRDSSRLGTHLKDKSSEGGRAGNDIISSFPATPTDPRAVHKLSQRDSLALHDEALEDKSSHRSRPSRNASKRESTSSYLSHIDSEAPTELQRESILSDDEGSIASTRVMSVTRQEESLIAAMRLKKATMRRAEALANRQGALKLLELGDSQGFREPRRPRSIYGELLHSRASALRAERDSQKPFGHRRSRSGEYIRSDSVTTFQTSLPDRSMRDSQATFMTDLSEELQLPYTSYATSAAGIVPSSLVRAESRQYSDQEGRYSSTSDESVRRQSMKNATRLSRDSHVVALDSLDKQLLREEIPSQLFLESPFLGWEARANLETTAH